MLFVHSRVLLCFLAKRFLGLWSPPLSALLLRLESRHHEGAPQTSWDYCFELMVPTPAPAPAMAVAALVVAEAAAATLSGYIRQ